MGSPAGKKPVTTPLAPGEKEKVRGSRGVLLRAVPAPRAIMQFSDGRLQIRKSEPAAFNSPKKTPPLSI